MRFISQSPRSLAALALLCGITAPAGSRGLRPAGLFDPPLAVMRAPAPPNTVNRGFPTKLTCYRYPGFVVKELDLGEKGAELLSIQTLEDGVPMPECQPEAGPGERVVEGSDYWVGYFAGAKGGYVLFDAADGWNGGIGFAVFAARDGAKLFEDLATSWRSAQLDANGALRLRYVRAYEAECSLARDADGCWRAVRAATGLTADTPPDCLADYERERIRVPKYAAEVFDYPTVIDYEVEVTLAAGLVSVTPAASAAMGCRLGS